MTRLDPVELQEVSPRLMTRFVDWARGHITNSKLRYALYCGLIEEFESLGMYDFGDCSIMDSHFKEAYDEMHNWEPPDEPKSKATEWAETMRQVYSVDSGVACAVCGSITLRTGSCYTCPSCGWNEGCS